MSDSEYTALRERMVADVTVHTVLQTGRLGKAALSRRVMEAMAKVPRHAFVRSELLHLAYADMPLPSDCGKTISQPFIVALMTDLLDLQPGDRVLEVGTGWGYQSAVLAELVAHVYSIELMAPLAEEARRRLARQGCTTVDIRVADGRAGWPEKAPFDKIIVSAAPDWVPVPLLEQLKAGGRMVIPAGGTEMQQLLLIEKDEAGRLASRAVLPVRFSALEEPEPG
jgi:protein-L-isoaspartate(D-aspartate) O-methyltransferase